MQDALAKGVVHKFMKQDDVTSTRSAANTSEMMAMMIALYAPQKDSSIMNFKCP